MDVLKMIFFGNFFEKLWSMGRQMGILKVKLAE
jgi:hypothetical protein